MTFKTKKSPLSKNLYSKKIRFVRAIPKFTASHSNLQSSVNLPKTQDWGRRRVKKVHIIKTGSNLYNIEGAKGIQKKGPLWITHDLTFLRKQLKSVTNTTDIKRKLFKVLTHTAKKFKTPAQKVRGVTSIVPLEYNPPLLNILQNKIMHNGRKGAAEKTVLRIVRDLNYYSKKGAGYRFLYVALETLKPTLITVIRRVGRNYYHVPVPVYGPRQYKFAFQWLLEVAKKNPRIPTHKSVVDEIVAIISSPSSEAQKKKETMYRSVITNRAYSHYRWI